MSCLRWPDIWGVDGDMTKVSAEATGGVQDAVKIPRKLDKFEWKRTEHSVRQKIPCRIPR